MTEPEADGMHEALAGMHYPCERAELVRHAAAQGADDGVLGHLCSLPERTYPGPDAVYEALGKGA